MNFWRRWVRKSSYKGRWREMVNRSALTLKLLTYAPTGALVAAPTFGLPEEIGGGRNWDYRFTWIRDASFTVYGLMRLGYTEEAAAFMSWIEDRCHDCSSDGSLQIMYGLDGRRELIEETLPHWKGYAGSSPVRIGNGAAGQFGLALCQIRCGSADGHIASRLPQFCLDGGHQSSVSGDAAIHFPVTGNEFATHESRSL